MGALWPSHTLVASVSAAVASPVTQLGPWEVPVVNENDAIQPFSAGPAHDHPQPRPLAVTDPTIAFAPVSREDDSFSNRHRTWNQNSNPDHNPNRSGGDGSLSFPIADNDAVAAVLARELKCDLLLLLSNVDSVYTGS